MNFYLKVILFLAFAFCHAYCLGTSIMIVQKIKAFGTLWAQPFNFFIIAFAILFMASIGAIIGIFYSKNFFGGHELWLAIPILFASILFLCGLIRYKKIITAYKEQSTSSTIQQIKDLTESIYGQV